MIREKGRIRGIPSEEMPRDMWEGIPLDRSEDVLSANAQNYTGWKMPKVWIVNRRKNTDADDRVVRLARFFVRASPVLDNVNAPRGWGPQWSVGGSDDSVSSMLATKAEG